eukprot:11049295-Ditylum_brightwellii.AAC.1
MMHPHRCFGSLGGRPTWFTSLCSGINGVTGWDQLGNHIGLPCSMPVDGASEEILAGYDGCFHFGIIA